MVCIELEYLYGPANSTLWQLFVMDLGDYYA